jgi:penicillin-binding protein 1A
VLRAAPTIITSRFTGQRMVGGSTITQQVAKNFLLGNEYSFDRKIREAILAMRLEQAFSKDHILELYMNEIYLGLGSYGVAAAAMNYFNKSLDELTVSEVAFLAGVPKAPNNYHPVRRPEAARERRDYVVGRMRADGYITRQQEEAAKLEPIIVRQRGNTELVAGGEYFAEEVAR